jgi:glutathione S-transferase
VYESLNCIAQKFPQAKLLPQAGTKEAALCQQWIFWVVAELQMMARPGFKKTLEY